MMVLKNTMYFLIISVVLSCNYRSDKETTLSSVIISHQECTDCYDAYVESGVLIIPDEIDKRIVEKEKQTGAQISRKDLILIGEGNISEELFGNQSNFIDKWNRKYQIDGYVTDFRDGALVFQVNSYKIIE
ncbi:hypothetical protein DSECCO2_663530 [anaerobic digester metagenome]